MADSPLTGYLLDSGFIDYAYHLCDSSSNHTLSAAVAPRTRRKAALVTDFLLELLDQTVDRERVHLNTLNQHRQSLNELPEATNTLSTQETFSTCLTAAQKVLTLPETLGVIISFLPVDRDLINACSTSRAFYNAIQIRHWSCMHDLHSVERQLGFAIGLILCQITNPNLGRTVKQVRIRVFGSCWNATLVKKVVLLIPEVTSLTLHWSDAEDGPVPVDTHAVTFFHEILIALPSLTYLSLAKFSDTPELPFAIPIPEGAARPFSNLESLHLNQFHWCWQPISQGLGSKLQLLDIGFGTRVHGNQIVSLADRLPSLKCIRISCDIDLNHLHGIILRIPKLERLHITQYQEAQDFIDGVVPTLYVLQNLKAFSLNLCLGPRQLSDLAGLSAPLEELSLTLLNTQEAEEWIAQICEAHQKTLERLTVIFKHRFLLDPSEALFQSLAKVSHLKHLQIDFNPDHQMLPVMIRVLLKSCPKLMLTQSLKRLLGNVGDESTGGD